MALTFEERLARIPTDGRHIIYARKKPGSVSQVQRPLWYAKWKGDDGKVQALYLGEDKDESIATRKAAQEQKRKENGIVTYPKDKWSYADQVSNFPPDFETTIVYDEQGQRIAIDTYTDYYFVGENYARTIYVKADGSRYVRDGYNPLTSDSDKEVPLAYFVWSIYNINPLSNSYSIVQKKPDVPGDPKDYRIRNLEVRRKPKSLDEQRVEAEHIKASRRRRKSA